MKFNKRASRNHNYTNLAHEQDFFLEVAQDNEAGSIVNITGQGNVQAGDTITIQLQVVEVEYYSDSPDMWRAKLSI